MKYWESYKDWMFGVHYDEMQGGKTLRLKRIRWLWDNVKINVLTFICWRKGHDTEITDYSGENGSEDWECKRCGMSGTHWFS